MKGHHIITIAISIAALLGAEGKAQQVRWHNENTDTLKINELLIASISISDPQERLFSMAQHFIDTPYVAGTLEAGTLEADTLEADTKESDSGAAGEMLTVNLDEVDCTTLIDYLAALTLTGSERRTSWRDFIYNLERMRYRGGELKGYPSRLHYISDWIVDNTHRGLVEEVTGRCDLATYEVKSLNFMSTNRNFYPALADSANFAAIRETESGYRNHRFPIIKTSRVGNAAKTFLRTGDIIALCTSKKGLDVSHMGVLFIDDKKTPYLLHASSKAGKVILDKTPLDRYLTQNRLTGIRVIRIK